MTFLIPKKYDHYAIVNDDADCIVGRVHPLSGRESPYRVTAEAGPMGRILAARPPMMAGRINSLYGARPNLKEL